MTHYFVLLAFLSFTLGISSRCFATCSEAMDLATQGFSIKGLDGENILSETKFKPSEQEISDFFLGEGEVEGVDNEVSSELDSLFNVNRLKENHRLSSANNYFFGFERRRIHRDFLLGRITESEATSAQIKNFRSIQYTSIDHRSLTGQFRTEAIDTFVHTGQKHEDGVYFTKEELDDYNNNIFFFVINQSVDSLSPDKFNASVSYVSSEYVTETIERVLKYGLMALQKASSSREKMVAIYKLQFALLCLHPFIDGNGRAIETSIQDILDYFDLPALPSNSEYSNRTFDEDFRHNMRMIESIEIN